MRRNELDTGTCESNTFFYRLLIVSIQSKHVCERFCDPLKFLNSHFNTSLDQTLNMTR